jgi:hypothetical protein
MRHFLAIYSTRTGWTRHCTRVSHGITAALEYTPPVLNCATVMAPTALPARQGAPIAADGNDFAETRFDLPEASDDITILEDLSILEERPDSPKPGVSVGELPGARRVDDDENMGIEVDPTLADEEQLDEDISILEECPDSPRPRVFVTSRRGRRRGVPAAAPPARRGRTCQVANCSNPAACPGRSNRGSCQLTSS